MGPSRQRRCHAIVQHAAVSSAGIRGRLHVSLHPPHTAIFSPGACSPGFAVSPPHPVWQAAEAVANLPLRLAVRVHCGCQVGRGSRGMPNPPRVLEGYSWHTLGVYRHRGFGVRVSVYGHLGTDGTARCEGCAAAVGRARLPSCG
jgi:hypothetical protein